MNNNVYKEAERKANKFNIYCLLVMSGLGILALILTLANVFPLDRTTMLVSVLDLVLAASAPYVVYLINDKIFKNKKSALDKPFFKYLILAIVFMCIFDLSIVLTFQGILLLAIPPLFVCQYRNNKRFFIIVVILSIIMVPISVYGSFFSGVVYDANLMKPLTAEEALDFKNRFEIATPKRMFEIFLHYVLPRTIILVAINFITATISKRNAEMIRTQFELSNRVEEEMKSRAHIQSEIILHLADVIESRDIETGEHIKRTRRYVSILAHAMQKTDKYKEILTDDYIQKLEEAAPLHDIGKIVVSDLILCKPGKLTDEEFEKMKVHTVKGGEIIKNILHYIDDKEFLNMSYDVAVSHHEKWNGKGYNYGLKEEEIPLSGRIMAIADVFDALVAERVYKKPMPVDDAINIIIKDAGTHFDPNIVEVFKTITEDFKKASKEKLINEE